MARTVNRLTDRTIRTLKEPGRYADGDGLYFVIDADGSRRWEVFFQWRGKRRTMGLGGLTKVNLAAAREAAKDAKDKAGRGIDPIAERKAPKRAEGVPTLGEAAETTILAMEKGWRNPNTGKSWRRSFKLHAAAITGKAIDDIDTEDVLQVLKPIWSTKAETAGKLRDRLETVIDAARAQGWRTGENPARWKGHLAHLLPKRQKLQRGHFQAMPFDEIPAFMVRLGVSAGISARALEWTVLTAAREGMTRFATWGEIDRAGRVWNIPAPRMKNNKAFRVPLSDAALAVLNRVRPAELGDPAADDWIFPGAKPGRPITDMAMDMMLRDIAPPYVPHGFRSSFRDWAGERTNFPREIAEQALAHHVGDEVERAYRRGDALEKRRKLMDAWAGFVTRPAAAGNVVPMRSV